MWHTLDIKRSHESREHGDSVLLVACSKSSEIIPLEDCIQSSQCRFNQEIRRGRLKEYAQGPTFRRHTTSQPPLRKMYICRSNLGNSSCTWHLYIGTDLCQASVSDVFKVDIDFCASLTAPSHYSTSAADLARCQERPCLPPPSDQSNY